MTVKHNSKKEFVEQFIKDIHEIPNDLEMSICETNSSSLSHYNNN